VFRKLLVPLDGTRLVSVRRFDQALWVSLLGEEVAT